jgi:hypothetical protein
MNFDLEGSVFFMAKKAVKPGPGARQTESGAKAAILEIDGKRYELIYNFNALCAAENLVGCNLFLGLAAVVLNTMTALQFRGILWALLQTKHPYRAATKDKPADGVSVDQVGHMIRLDTCPAIVDAISEALNLSMPKASAANV